MFLLEKPFQKNIFLNVSFYKTFWSSTIITNNNYVCFDFNSFFTCLKFLINNSYVNFGNKIFHQKIGIPMGQNYSPLLADLFLFYCEYNFLKSLSNHHLKSKFNNVTRYIDDVAVINFPEFETYLKNIYPKALSVTKDAGTKDSIHYLDIKILFQNPVSFTIFDKRDEFDFSICNFPFNSSNMPYKMIYSVFVSQLFRFTNLCSNSDLFKEKLCNLISKLLKQGYHNKILRYLFYKFTKNIKVNELTGFNYIKNVNFP
jgi:hypothetical protein